eukprot:Blabericola_migrator_1__10451@NODE_5918_length_641_cov_346_454704_g3791_i1_p1_GENE_NODE_5918_length_641_cov_346_454704_g3791_i1NODE_5918_length_641_cov_346_454704_g3791_i1_p1_ORF_typecomplete_len110_score26_03ubiquitin/PF00240_23/0_00025RBD/PF02196_15/0_0017Rad60SLD/PF11976_8/0_014UN_NPL4/PF11543_8/0_11Ubiquitin_2/PF14560_6/0_15_NODE_5918_length_641_cov_346_454704_g3791_i1202531
MASMNPDARESGGLSLPPKNPELREQEKLTLHGDEVMLTVIMPDGQEHQLQVKQGMEVKKVKVSLQSQLGINYSKFDLYYEDKLLIDPISLVDGWGPNPKHFNVHLKMK